MTGVAGTDTVPTEVPMMEDTSEDGAEPTDVPIMDVAELSGAVLAGEDGAE